MSALVKNMAKSALRISACHVSRSNLDVSTDIGEGVGFKGYVRIVGRLW